MRLPTQVNVDPIMTEMIRARANRMRRSVGSEIIHLITIGLSHDPDQTVYEHFLLHAQTMAPPRKVTHNDARERKLA